MLFDKPITVQRQNQDTEAWEPAWFLHARINKTGGGQAMTAGADQFRATLTFELRYFDALDAVRYNPQLYRVVYRGHTFKVADYDDYQEQHRVIKIAGELYG